MSVFHPFALALCLAATGPALADPASDYEQLRKAFPTLLFGTDVGLHMKLNSEVIRRLEGRWTLISPLLEDGITFPDAELVAKSCDKLGYTLTREGFVGLTLSLPTHSDPYLIHLHYAGGTTYIATYDEAGMMARIFPGKAVDEVPANALYSALVSSMWQGYISMVPAGEDLILLQPLSRPPELLARCR
ncbi:MAG: hypothetical protein WBP18_09965 [Paracoccaceae bacterium]